MAKKLTKEPVLCPCYRHATGIAYGAKVGGPLVWLCDDCKRTEIGRTYFHMHPRDLDSYEAFSLSDAGDAAGEYLESIGKTDLASLEREEWLKLLKTVLETYSEKMKERLLSHAAPF